MTINLNRYAPCVSLSARHLVRPQTPPVEQVLVLPNPASNQISLIFQSATAGIYRVQISDLAGRFVLDTETSSDGTVLDLNVSSLKNGLYVCHVSTPGFSFAPVKLSIIR